MKQQLRVLPRTHFERGISYQFELYFSDFNVAHQTLESVTIACERNFWGEQWAVEYVKAIDKVNNKLYTFNVNKTLGWYTTIRPNSVQDIIFPNPAGVTVYVWTFLGEYSFWGHAALGLHDGTHVSWWPGNVLTTDSLKSIVGDQPAAQNRSYTEDVSAERGNVADKVYRLLTLDEAAIKSWWNTFNTPSAVYNGTTQNCSTVVAKALIAGGCRRLLTDREQQNLIDNILVWTPNDVERLASTLATK